LVDNGHHKQNKFKFITTSLIDVDIIDEKESERDIKGNEKETREEGEREIIE
jgi:hypothetical protein